MTYDVELRKNGRVFPTPLTIHGLGYGTETFDWVREFIFADKNLSKEEVIRLGKKFHKLMVKYCQEVTGDKSYFGSSGSGYYFNPNSYKKGHNSDKFDVAIRWLQIYTTAMAFGCEIDFH